MNMKKVIIATGTGLALFSTTINAAELKLGNGWTGSVGLQIQAFAVSVDDKLADKTTSRIQSGFDPSKLTFGIKAPEYNGINVSGTYQLVQPIQNGVDNVNPDTPERRQVRVAEVAVEGGFGKFTAGRSFAIYGKQGLIHDTGSLPGVGRGAGGAGATAGRIDYGYVYPNFHPSFQYHSKNMGGFSYALGVFDPTGPGSDELRFEGELKYNAENFDVWTSFSEANGGGNNEISGYDLGGEVRLGQLGLTANYSSGTGTLCCNPSTDDLDQWYVEADYTVGKTTFGASYGENEVSDSTGAKTSEGELVMAFVHHKLTPQLTLVGEFNNEQVANAAGTDTKDVSTLALGVNYQF